MAARVWGVFLASLAVFVACGLALPLIGSVSVNYPEAWRGVEPHHQILFTLRVPRVWLALVAGGALGTAGLLFQALLRDALATPYTLGVSAGASLGAVVAISFGLTLIWPAAIVAAILTLALVLGIAARQRSISPFVLLMTGVTVNSICLAGVLFLQSIATFSQSFAITRWLMGDLVSPDWPTLGWLSLISVCGVIAAFADARAWNLLAVGEEWAAIRGVDSGRLMIRGYVLGSVLTGAVTALTGPVGFVGLIVPHALRLWLGADHRVLVPASFLLGGVFLAVCDTVGRTILPPAEVPVGVITAMLGGPFFIWLLRTGRNAR